MQLRSADLSGEKKKKSWGKKPTTQLLRMVLVSQLLQCRNVFTASEEGETDSRCQSTRVGV